MLRPISRRVVGEPIADARDKEEVEATRILRELEKTDIFSKEFDERLGRLERAVSAHAEREEVEEFPVVRAGCDAAKLHTLGSTLRAVERFAPTHPHPGTAGSSLRQWTVGPFASVVDRVKDTIQKADRSGHGGASGGPV